MDLVKNWPILSLNLPNHQNILHMGVYKSVGIYSCHKLMHNVVTSLLKEKAVTIDL